MLLILNMFIFNNFIFVNFLFYLLDKHALFGYYSKGMKAAAYCNWFDFKM